jgi:hypothetical protein
VVVLVEEGLFERSEKEIRVEYKEEGLQIAYGLESVVRRESVVIF